jgi:hypothetical protein
MRVAELGHLSNRPDPRWRHWRTSDRLPFLVPLADEEQRAGSSQELYTKARPVGCSAGTVENFSPRPGSERPWMRPRCQPMLAVALAWCGLPPFKSPDEAASANCGRRRHR